MPPELMTLKILLPSQIFVKTEGVSRIVAESLGGSMGLLPHRLDCIMALVPGILLYETLEHGEVYVAVDEGILVKTGLEVHVSVRKAVSGVDLLELRDTIDREFLNLSEREKDVRSVMIKMESGFIRRLTDFYHE